MQKFTAFSILLSLVVVLMTLDVLFHGYLNDPGAVVTEAPAETSPEEVLPVPNPSITVPASEDDLVELQEEVAPPLITADLLTQAGFANPVLKEAMFSGLVFQIIPYSSLNDSDVLQFNVFDGEIYVGTFYELIYATETGSFQGYLDLRESAKTLPDLGSVNEVNLYGDASFYFNHKTQLKTIHMIALHGNRVFAFEYAQSEHDKMKKLFDILKTLQ